MYSEGNDGKDDCTCGAGGNDLSHYTAQHPRQLKGQQSGGASWFAMECFKNVQKYFIKFEIGTSQTPAVKLHRKKCTFQPYVESITLVSKYAFLWQTDTAQG